MMLAALFLPWWRISVSNTLPVATTEAINRYNHQSSQTLRILRRNDSKYITLFGEGRWLKIKRKIVSEYEVRGYVNSSLLNGTTERTKGSDHGTGIAAFVVGIALLPIAVLPWIVRRLGRWIWPGYFAAAIAGLVVFILSLVWYFSVPDQDVDGFLVQGVGLSPGPYLVICGGLAVVIAGSLGGIFGLMGFLKGRAAPDPRDMAERINQRRS